MKHLNTKHAIAVAVAIAMIVLLYAAPNKHTTDVQLDIALDKKVAEAVALVQGDAPMQGIVMLKEVLEEDPENVSALMYLGAFSVQTGQYDKAVERLEKAVAIEPSATDAWFYLGVSYRELGQNEHS